MFVDGAFVPELSDLAGLEPGLTIGSLAQALAKGDAAGRRAARHGRADATTSALALNTAFMGDGAVIRVAPARTLARPIHLVFVNAGDTAGVACSPARWS